MTRDRSTFALGALAVALLCAATLAPGKAVVGDSASLSSLRMVQVEAEIYEVAHTGGSALGVDWRWERREGSTGDLLDSVAKFPIGIDEQANITVSVLDLKYGVLTATLQAAMDRGHARLLSRLHTWTRDGETGEISSGEQVPFTTLSTIANNLPQGLVTEYRQTGVTLQVTPRILPQTEVQVGDETRTVQKIAIQLRPSVSDIMRTERLEVMRADKKREVYDLPVIAQRSVETMVIVRDGQTLVLGGLLEERYDEMKQGVPWLSSVPVVGNAFKTTSTRSITTEVVMYVTPRIADPGSDYLARVGQENAESAAPAPQPSQPQETATGEAAAPEHVRNYATVPPSGEPTYSENLVTVEGARTFIETGGDTPYLGRRNKVVATANVLNRSDRRINDVMVEAALYDDLGNLIDVVVKRVGTLRGGQQRPFRLEFENFDENFNNVYIAHQVRYKTYFNF